MSQENNKKKDNYLFNTLIIATGAATATFLADTFCYPMDTINTWIKTSSRHESSLKIIKEHVRTDGWKVFFYGVNTQFYVAFVPGMIYYTCYELSNRLGKRALEYFNKSSYSMFIPTITASLSECASLAIMVPMDALKTRMQLNTPEYNYPNVLAGLKDIINKEGYFRLFKASPLYIIHAIVFNTVLFQAYELSRISMMKRSGLKNSDLTLMDSLKNTLMATVAATFITNPLDLVITRYQVMDSSAANLSWKAIVRQVIKADGYQGLNRGVFFRTFYQCIEACVYLPVYEELRKHYGTDFAT